MKTLFPPALKIGDTIGVMAPSSRFAREDLESAATILKGYGFKVFIHPQCYETHHQSAGTHEQKIAALHELASDKSINAVFFAAGGNRALHLLEHMDFGLIASNPKIYIGFSDCTVLLNAITANTGIVTWHGPTLRKFHVGHAQEKLNIDLLIGNTKIIPLSAAIELNSGTAQGSLYGGTLSVFKRLIASKDMPDLTNAILFFEDCNEELSRIDAELCFMRRSGIFEKAVGIIFGQFINMLDTGTPFGFTLEDIIREHTDGLNIPILMNAPFGHGNDLPAFPIGANVRLENKALTIL